MEKILHTNFGKAKKNQSHGYYVITSPYKSPYYGKRLHRLIFEDFYGQIPNNCSIHHIDEDKTNNCIMNLQLLPTGYHNELHNRGKKFSEKYCQSQSKKKNTTGYYRVNKQNDKSCKQGFRWTYRYYDNNKRKLISSINIKNLEKKVKSKGLPWIKFEEDNDS